MSSQTTSVIFSCAQQSNTISNKVKVLLGNLFDFVVIAGVDNTKIEAHRNVLSASNDFFEAMFRSNLREAKTNEVEFKDIDGSTIKSIIDFIYTASIDLNIETVQTLLEAAEFLQMKTVVTACCDFIGKQLDFSNCLAIALFADYYGHTGLQSTSYSFAWKHFDEVWTNEDAEFCQLNEEQLSRLLSSDHLVTCSEEKVFQSVVAWIKYDEENRNKLLSKVMSNVRFPLLDPKFIVENRHSLCQSIEWYQLMSSWLQWHFSPESRSNYPPEQTKPRKPLCVPQSLMEVFHDADEDSFEEFSNENSSEYEVESVDHSAIDPDETSDDSSFGFGEENDEFFVDNEHEPDEDEFFVDNEHEPDEDEFFVDNDVCNELDEYIDNCDYEEIDECPDPDCYNEMDDEDLIDQFSPQEDSDNDFDDYIDLDYCY